MNQTQIVNRKFYEKICSALNINLENCLNSEKEKQISFHEFILEEQKLTKEKNLEERKKWIQKYQMQNYEQTMRKLVYKNESEYKTKQKIEEMVLENFKLFLMINYQLSFDVVEKNFSKIKQLLYYFSLHTNLDTSDFFAILQGDNKIVINELTHLLNQSEEELLLHPSLVIDNKSCLTYMKTLGKKVTTSEIDDIKFGLEVLFTKELATHYLDFIMANINFDISELYQLTDDLLNSSNLISAIYKNQEKQTQNMIPIIDTIIDSIITQYSLKRNIISNHKKYLNFMIDESKKNIQDILTLMKSAKQDVKRIKQDMKKKKQPIYTTLSKQAQTNLAFLMRNQIEEFLRVGKNSSPGIFEFLKSTYLINNNDDFKTKLDIPIKLDQDTSANIDCVYVFLSQQAALNKIQMERKTKQSTHSTSKESNSTSVKTELVTKTKEIDKEQVQGQIKLDKEHEYNVKKQMFLDTYWDAYLLCTEEEQFQGLLGTKDVFFKINCLLEKIEKEVIELNTLRELAETKEELQEMKEELWKLESLKSKLEAIEPCQPSFQKRNIPKK